MAKKTKTGKRVRTKQPVRRQANRSGVSKGGARALRQIVLPSALVSSLLICLTALGYMGYQRVSASDFFNVRHIDVIGADRTSRSAIENIVKTETERTGSLRSDISTIRAKIEALPFVRTAAVTRVLPNGIRVRVIERQPTALVTRNAQNYLADSEGTILALAEKAEPNLPFAMLGWDEAKSEKAERDNVERVKMYQRMLTEWKNNSTVSKVLAVDLSDLRKPRAMVLDSGLSVTIAVGKENFGDNLARGIKAIVGKGNMFEGVDLVGSNMVLASRKAN